MPALSSPLALVGVAAAVGVGIYLLTRKGIAANVGQAAGEATVGFGTGAVYGLGAVFGVPPTNDEKCAQARAAGNLLDASLYCPAAVFVGTAAGSALDAANRATGATDGTGNVISNGVNDFGAWFTRDQNWTLGGQIYDWTH